MGDFNGYGGAGYPLDNEAHSPLPKLTIAMIAVSIWSELGSAIFGRHIGGESQAQKDALSKRKRRAALRRTANGFGDTTNNSRP